MLIAILGAALAGNLTLMAFDPISILTRGLASFLLPGLNQATMGLEHVLYNVAPLQGALDWFEVVRPHVALSGGCVALVESCAGAAAVGVVALNWVAERFWCRYLCPLGGLARPDQPRGDLAARRGRGCLPSLPTLRACLSHRDD